MVPKGAVYVREGHEKIQAGGVWGGPGELITAAPIREKKNNPHNEKIPANKAVLKTRYDSKDI